MVTHELKLSSRYFEAVANGKKTFEIRFNDRDYQVGDVLLLREYHNNDYTGRELKVVVTFITIYKQKTGYVVLAIKLVKDKYLYTEPSGRVDMIPELITIRHPEHPDYKDELETATDIRVELNAQSLAKMFKENKNKGGIL